MDKKITLKEFGRAFLKLIFGMAVVVGLISWGMSSQKKHDDKFPWKGSVASVSDDRKNVLDSKDFTTLEKCRAWAKDKLSDYDLTSLTGSFTCGTDCTWNDDTIVGGKRVNTYTCSELVTE